ncbi:MAG: hypothetical protein ACRC9O_09640 [Plesiomonas sp.]|uniref:hypothetical protein n=1 Tax=Plesiomonas sp. TaxID=2486279 RepID=UPI003F2CF346
MTSDIKVKAGRGLRVPMESAPFHYISNTEFVSVPNTAYYRRLIASGDITTAKRNNKKVSEEGQHDHQL